MNPLRTEASPLARFGGIDRTALAPVRGSAWNDAPRGMMSTRPALGRLGAPAERTVVDKAIDVYNDLARGEPLDAGSKAASIAVNELIDSVTFFSEYDLWPPVTKTAADLIRDSGEVDPHAADPVKAGKPTLIVRFKHGLGTRVIAPGGRADPTAWERNRMRAFGLGVAAVTGTLVVGGLIGWILRGREARAARAGA